MDFQLLHRIYRFPGWDIPEDQGKDTCLKLSRLFMQFSQHMAQDNRHEKEPKSGHSQACYEFAFKCLHLMQRPANSQQEYMECTSSQVKYLAPHIEWFPAYGCAVIFHTSPGQWSSKLSIDVIGLDGHELEIHRGGKAYQYTSTAKTYASLHVGEISVDKKITYLTLFRDLFEIGSRKKGNDRSAANGKQGHQKTPAFIHAILLQAMVFKRSDVVITPKGGFTDCGLHTGGQKRDTCYALVRSVFQFFMDQGSTLLDDVDSSISEICFEPVMIHFHMYLLRNVDTELDGIDAAISSETVKLNVDPRIKRIFHILQYVAVFAARLSDDEYNLLEYYERMKRIRDKQEKSISKWDGANLKKYCMDGKDFYPQAPQIGVTEFIPPMRGNELSSETLQKTIHQNIGICIRPRSNGDIKQTATWARIQVNGGSAKSCTRYFLCMREIENVFWGICENNLGSQPLAIDTLRDIMEMIDSYRNAVWLYFNSNSDAKDTLAIRVQSVELLLVWVGYCAVFNSVQRAHSSTLEGFGVALRYQDLKHLVLHHPTHLTAMKKIAQFLKRHHVKSSELFAARECQNWDSPTLQMASKYADCHLLSIWEREKQIAEKRVQKHWDAVVEKKQLAQRLREEIDRLNSDLGAERLKEAEISKEETYYYHSSTATSIRNKINHLKHIIFNKERELESARTPPSPVIQPLPEDGTKAKKVLFFLCMPDEFRYLSRLTFTAQQLLVPKSWTCNTYHGPGSSKSFNVLDKLAVRQEIFDWTLHHDNQQECYNTSKYRQNKILDVRLSMHENIPTSYGPSTIEDYTSKSEGVWYPDQSNVRLVWKGGKNDWDPYRSHLEFNPFKISGDISASYFTEQLSEDFSNLQWSLVVQEKLCPQNVGNIPYASQHLKPSLLSKEAYVDFCSVRPLPRMALRKLCIAMNKGSLPLQYENVQKLVRQTLYQIGELRYTQNELKMQWRYNDLEEISMAFETILKTLSDDHTQRPHLYKASAIIGEMASYFTCLPDLHDLPEINALKKAIPMNLAQAVMNWGTHYDNQIQVTPPEKRPSIRSKQVIFFRTAIMCVVHGKIDEKSAKLILGCTVRAQNSFVRNDDESLERSSLKDQCEYYLVNKLQAYLDILIRNNGMILSEVLSTVISRVPKNLDWRREVQSDVSFTAQVANGETYSINALTGTVLVNGLPPNQLPPSITEHKMYQKVFSKNNFEVTVRSGVFETTQRIFGRYYRFHSAANTLVIQESPHEGSQNSIDPWDDHLELMPVDAIKWSENFPTKLRNSFSHWLSRKHGVIVFRLFDFSEREIYYLYNIHHGVKHIPEYINGRECWPSLTAKMGDRDSLVLHNGKFLDILERFETRCMILTTHIGDKGYCINLHRFALEFHFSETCEKWKCSQVAGYHLRRNQHLSGHLRGLNQYLVLDSDDEQKTKVIIPFGHIKRDSHKGVTINLLTSIDGKWYPSKNEAEEQLLFHTFEVHPRFGYLIANSLSARLFLAALYLASSSSVPDIVIGMTGEAMAIELLRRCMVNRPLSGEEEYCLQNAKELCKFLSPTSYIICHDIEQNSTNYEFLQGNSPIARKVHSDPIMFADEATAYVAITKKTMNPRLLLNEGECQRCLGQRDPSGNKKPRRATRQLLDVEKCPVDRENIIGEIQERLGSLWEEVETQASESRFPLSKSYETHLEKVNFGELEKSWNLHTQMKKKTIVIKPDAFRSIYQVKELITNSLSRIDEYLIVALNRPHNSRGGTHSHWRTQTLQLLKLVDILPLATTKDMMTIACNRAQIRKFNPLLSSRAQDLTFNAILLYLELCIENDKVDYLLSFGPNSNFNENPAFIEELAASRKWNIKQHPYWLVFEAEQGIRIRQEQYEVAKHLIENNGSAIQLNMGRGKTRVILPMLILFWSFSKDVTYTARLVILSALLREGSDYFHNSLCGGHLGRKLFELPFQRDIELNEGKVRLLKDMVNQCKRERGFVIVAPEHRLSMELKVKELHLNGKTELSNELQSVLSSSWCDIIDEVDEVLHHRFQLVYSTGSVLPLPQGSHRWEVIEALLATLKTSQIVGLQIHSNDDVPGAFPQVAVDDDIDKAKFRQNLALILMTDPPQRLAWLQDHCKKNLIFHAIAFPEIDPTELHLSEEHLNDVLSLRGLLAFDILLHCLRKRHRVDFGVNKEGKKRISVPFRGADTPSQRAQFSHPDCAILFTLLAYYDHGLDRCQTKKAFEALLRKGKNARAVVYDEWLCASMDSMETNEYESVSNSNKIDLTNTAQFEVLFAHFSRNPGTIHLWLNSCVFPGELDQYPKRLVANSWQLAHYNKARDHCVGFSGTNDNHQVLPLQIKQHLPWDTSNNIWRNLLATNGRMLNVMIEKTKSCEELGEGKGNEKLLSYIASSCNDQNTHIDALIDSGALLAGSSNFSVAKRILKECIVENNSRLKGVTFFDEERKAWMILEPSGRCTKKDQSPLDEKDTFALFDEPRCRGVDLKLRHDAIALLTLGQGICKDKLMQAAGRMRQLSRGQKLVILGETKVFNEIRRVRTSKHLSEINKLFLHDEDMRDRLISEIKNSTEDVKIKHVLTWVIHNTIESIWRGLDTWSAQGMFHATATKPEHAVLDEAMDLQAFYGKPKHESSVADLAASAKEFYSSRTDGGNEELMKEITKRCSTLGTSYTLMKTDADEECEREIEREVEEEEEEDVEYSRMMTHSEVDWDYSSIMASGSVQDLPVAVYDISNVICNYMTCESLSKIKWSKQVFCTKNFIKTVETDGKIDDFLRIPDCFVHFPCESGEILLLSDREANQVLPLFQERRRNPRSSDNGSYFGHYSFEIENQNSPFLRCGEDGAMSDDIVCSLKLFNGETMYPGSQRNALKNMLLGATEGAASGGAFSLTKASGEPEHLVSARRKDPDFDCSDLQKICSEIACDVEIIG